jgi:hypothetical protein
VFSSSSLKWYASYVPCILFCMVDMVVTRLQIFGTGTAVVGRVMTSD